MSAAVSKSIVDLLIAGGVESPEEIALAVVSEMQHVFKGGTGVSLRERKSPIHNARSSENERHSHLNPLPSGEEEEIPLARQKKRLDEP